MRSPHRQGLSSAVPLHQVSSCEQYVTWCEQEAGLREGPGMGVAGLAGKSCPQFAMVRG